MRIPSLPPSTSVPLEQSPTHPLQEPATPSRLPSDEPQGEHTRSKRGLFSNPFRRTLPIPGRPPSVVPPRPPVVPPSPKPPTRAPRDGFKDLSSKLLGQAGPNVLPSQGHIAPKTLADVTQNLIVADRLHKAGVFSNEPKLGTVARDAFVNASVNGVVSAPISIATYAGSAWTGEAIKGQYSAQTPILPPIHGPAPSTQVGTVPAPVETPTQLEAQLKLAELRLEVVANNIMAVRQGTDSAALQLIEQGTASIGERLKTLEGLYDVAEEQLTLIGNGKYMTFRPHPREGDPSTKTDSARLEHLGKRFEALNKFIGKLIVLNSLELPIETPVVTTTA